MWAFSVFYIYISLDINPLMLMLINYWFMQIYANDNVMKYFSWTFAVKDKYLNPYIFWKVELHAFTLIQTVFKNGYHGNTRIQSIWPCYHGNIIQKMLKMTFRHWWINNLLHFYTKVHLFQITLV